jgi:hypothetical protein
MVDGQNLFLLQKSKGYVVIMPFMISKWPLACCRDPLRGLEILQRTKNVAGLDKVVRVKSVHAPCLCQSAENK